MSDVAQPQQVVPQPQNPNLFPCPDCNRMCSRAAASCPQCGRPFAARQQQSPPTQPLYPVATHPAPPQVHYHNYPQPFRQQQLWSPGVAALLSFLIPGVGQLYKGRVGSGLVWFFAVIVGYMMLILPGLILHVICIVAAASGDPYRRGG
jgi:TM2 domain-containing membrane protein YozV